MHKLAAVLASVLLLLGGAACGGGSEANTSTEPSDSLDTGAPEQEDTDAEEEADNTGGDAVAVELPGLPIGGNAAVVSDTLQCVDVGWTEPPDLPDWIGITVTGVAFTPAEGFTQSSEPCPDGTPPCLAAGFQLTGDERCHVAVAWTGEPTFEAERTMTFSSGVINCPPDRVEECEAFRAEVESEGPQSIPLDPHPSEFETDPDETDQTDPENTEESTPDATDSEG